MRPAASRLSAQRPLGARLARSSAQACWDARHALQLARRGERSGGRQLIDHLRQEFQGREFAELSIRLSLAEGILSLPAVAGAVAPWAARDRFTRAWALGRHHADTGLAALAGAWSAHGLLAAGHWKPFAEAVVTGLRSARSADHEALARWALSLGNACLLADDPQRAQTWYEWARRQACADQDGAALADTLCDLAWHQTQRLQLRQAAQQEGESPAADPRCIERAQRSLQTARAYVLLRSTESVSARYFNLICAKAIICKLQRRWGDELSCWDQALVAHRAWSAQSPAGAQHLPEEQGAAQVVAVQQWCARLAHSPCDADLRHPPSLETLESWGDAAAAVERLKLWDSVWRAITRLPAARQRRLGAGYYSVVVERRHQAQALWLEQQRELRACLQGDDLAPHVWTSRYEP